MAKGRGRPICRETKLGRLLDDRELAGYAVAAACGFSARVLTEYCAGRRRISPTHLVALAEHLHVSTDDLIEDDLTEDLTRTSGVPIDPQYKSVRELPKYINAKGVPVNA